jgi:DNA-binding MarR family transcriptional regulator
MSIELARGLPAPNMSTSEQLEGFLLSLLRLASVVNESAIFADHGIGLAEWALLKDIGDERMPLTLLWRRSRLSRQRVRVLVRELERKGFVEVTDADGDRRGRMIITMPTGTEALRSISAKLSSLDVPAKGKGIPRAARLAEQLLRTLRQTKKRQRSSLVMKLPKRSSLAMKLPN